MRIIAGQFRGRKLRPPGDRIRPTADRVKEALFSVLGATVTGARVLDLFAGTGSLGLEALSRGAKWADFVEISRGAEKTLRDNVALLNVGDRVGVIRADAIKFAARLGAGDYDIAFADPPYGMGWGEKIRDVYLVNRFSRVLCVEHRIGELEGARDSRRYGDTELSIFEDE